MNAYHILAITSTRYRLIETIASGTLEQAAERCIDTHSASCAIVLRDGHTGKRYSQHECGALIGVDSWQMLIRRDRQAQAGTLRRAVPLRHQRSQAAQ